MKPNSLIPLVIIAVVVVGAFYAFTRRQEAPPPVAETAKPAAETAPASTAPAADSMSGMTGNAPAAKPAGNECTQYTWDGVQWTCTSAAAAGN